METACLRIKFTPLLQNIHQKDSKHCLEIVPQITCIQNLDKIQWRKEENSIEYTIPMTYKIILRKKHFIKDNEEALEKTYHSCVDLLLPSSDTNFTALGSGDVSRILSDTFVLSKVTTDVEKCSILLKEPSVENKITKSTDLASTHVQTEGNHYSLFSDQLTNNATFKRTNYKSRETAVTQTSPEVFQNESHVIQVPYDDVVGCIQKSVDKITNTEVSNGVEVKSISFEDVDHILSIDSKTETKRNLSVTPICSINTDDQTETARRIDSNTIVYLRYESQKEFPCSKFSANAIKSEVNPYFGVYQRNNKIQICKVPKQYNYVTNPKLNPEVRVANFVQIMEQEIMPLKLMLSDIITKCSCLGVGWQKAQINPTVYKNVPSCEKQISRCLKTKKQSNSNRVVYTIVFDG